MAEVGPIALLDYEAEEIFAVIDDDASGSHSLACLLIGKESEENVPAISTRLAGELWQRLQAVMTTDRFQELVAAFVIDTKEQPKRAVNQ
jgi:hypothetical protein